MSRRKKGAVRPGHGSMCKVCGKNCGKGGALKKHIEGAHGVTYEDNKTCFYSGSKVLVDAWDDSVSTSKGSTVATHVLARRFILPEGAKPVTRSERRQTPN